MRTYFKKNFYATILNYLAFMFFYHKKHYQMFKYRNKNN